METLRSLVIRLYNFWYRTFESLWPEADTDETADLPIKDNRGQNDDLADQLHDVLVSEFKSLKDIVADHPLPTVRKDVLLPLVTSEAPITTEAHTVVVVRTDEPLYKHPTKEFDGVLKRIPYGTKLTLNEEKGGWANVHYDHRAGWVEREGISNQIAQTRPYFIIKEYCGAEHEVTKRIRSRIGDVFHGGEAGLPLHAEEYIYYKLFSRGIVLPDTKERPRLAGRWKDLFKGKEKVHIMVQPKSGTIMEYATDEDQGRLAYVEAVFPDDSISLSEVGEPEAGYYNERILGKEVWQELQPVFIQFS